MESRGVDIQDQDIQGDSTLANDVQREELVPTITIKDNYVLDIKG